MPQRRKRNRPSGVEKRARRQTKLAFDPYFDEIRNQKQSARQDTRQAIGQTKNVYGALQNTIEGLQPRYRDLSNAIESDFKGDVQGVAGMFGNNRGLAAGEDTAARGLGATLATGGLQNLASQQGRNLAYNSSAQRRAGVEKTSVIQNYRTDMRDLIDNLRTQKLDLKRDMGSQILERVDQLQDQKDQMGLARAEFGLRKETAKKQFNLDKKEMANLDKYTDSLIGTAKGNRADARNKGKGDGGGDKGGPKKLTGAQWRRRKRRRKNRRKKPGDPGTGPPRRK